MDRSKKNIESISIKKIDNFMETYYKILEAIQRTKSVDLRAAGQAIGRAISLAQKIVNENQIEYTRMTTQQIQMNDRMGVLCIIRLTAKTSKVGNNEELQSPTQKKIDNKMHYKQKKTSSKFQPK